MNKEFPPYEQSLELKELGFDEPCFGYYEDNNLTITFPSTSENGWKWVGNSIIPCKNTKAPLYQQSFRWLLEKHNLYGIIIPTVTMNWTFKTMTVAQGMVEVPPYNHVDAYDYSSREESELACLKKLIEIVKQKL
jgi:hypothetical protein